MPIRTDTVKNTKVSSCDGLVESTQCYGFGLQHPVHGGSKSYFQFAVAGLAIWACRDVHLIRLKVGL